MKKNSVTVDKVAQASGIFDEEGILYYADQEMLPALRDEKWKFKL